MSLSLHGLNGARPAMPLPPMPGASQAAETSGGSFKDLLVNSLQQVNSMQMEANQAVETMAGGGDVNPAEVLTAVQKADLAFRMTMQIRNKLVQAYQEIQNIRI